MASAPGGRDELRRLEIRNPRPTPPAPARDSRSQKCRREVWACADPGGAGVVDISDFREALDSSALFTEDDLSAQERSILLSFLNQCGWCEVQQEELTKVFALLTLLRMERSRVMHQTLSRAGWPQLRKDPTGGLDFWDVQTPLDPRSTPDRHRIDLGSTPC